MTLQETLEIIGKEITTLARANLQRATTHGVRGKRYNSIASGKLYNSIGYKITKKGNDLQLEYIMEDYGKFIDQGRNPTKSSGNGSFEKSLKQWMIDKKIDSKYLYIIKKNIHKNGFRATKFFTKAYNKVMKDTDKVINEYVDNLVDEYLNDFM